MPRSFFCFTLVTGPRWSLSLKLSDIRVYEPQIRARLGTTAHFCEVVVLKLRGLGFGTHHCPGPEREFFIDNLLVRIHFILEMIWWTGLAPWEFELPFPGSLISTFLDPPPRFHAHHCPGPFFFFITLEPGVE